jgi:hypothetical protein
MKTFLKVLLIAALLIIAIKISPLLFVAAFAGLVAAAVLGVIGISLLVGLIAVVLAFTVALSPIWIPILIALCIVNLCRKSNGTPPALTA